MSKTKELTKDYILSPIPLFNFCACSTNDETAPLKSE